MGSNRVSWLISFIPFICQTHVNSVCLFCDENVGGKIGERLANVCLDIRLQEKCVDTCCAENKCRKSDLQSSLIKFQLTSWRRISTYLVRFVRVSLLSKKNTYERRFINSDNRYNWWYICINWEIVLWAICLIEGSMLSHRWCLVSHGDFGLHVEIWLQRLNGTWKSTVWYGTWKFDLWKIWECLKLRENFEIWRFGSKFWESFETLQIVKI